MTDETTLKEIADGKARGDYFLRTIASAEHPGTRALVSKFGEGDEPPHPQVAKLNMQEVLDVLNLLCVDHID